jgi:DNA-directed RNA polymerase subunit F
MLVLDYDNTSRLSKAMVDTPVYPEMVALVLDGLNFVIATSHSHTDEWPKFRVVIALAESVPGDDWGRFVGAALASTGLDAFAYAMDPAVRNAAQAYYWPSHAPGRPFTFIEGKGADLDVKVPTVDSVAWSGRTSEGGKKDDRFTPEQISKFYAQEVPQMHQGADSREWKCACPLHDGEDPNFCVNAHSGQWHCFSRCPEGENGGDLYRFYELMHKVPFPEAKRAVDEMLGIVEASPMDAALAIIDATGEAALDPEGFEQVTDAIAKIPKQGDRSKAITQLVTVCPNLPREEVVEVVAEKCKVVRHPNWDAAISVEEAEIRRRVEERIPDDYGMCLPADRFDVSDKGIYKTKWKVFRDGSKQITQADEPIATRPIWPGCTAIDVATGQPTSTCNGWDRT